MSDHPYRDLAADQFWATGGASADPPSDLLRGMKFTISPSDPVATAGSCFAQYLGPFLREQGYNFFLAETPGPPEAAVFSARTGTIHTARQLHQLLLGAYGLHRPAARAWQRVDARFVDPLRPRLFPAGFATAAEVTAQRRSHLAAVRRVFQECRVFVFTLGATEAWLAPDGTVLPLPPDADDLRPGNGAATLHNFTAAETREDLERFLGDFVAVNPRVQLVLTVSPVPQAATFLPRHVLISHSYSKAALLVAAQETALAHDNVAYFPAYEIATAPALRGRYFAEDWRHVTSDGVAEMMRLFQARVMQAQDAPAAKPADPALLADLFEEPAMPEETAARQPFVVAAAQAAPPGGAARLRSRPGGTATPAGASAPDEAEDLADAAALVQRGLRYKRIFRYALAERDYRRALTLTPSSADARLNLAHILRDTRRVDEALAIFEGLLSDPSGGHAERARYEAGQMHRSLWRHAVGARILAPLIETGHAHYFPDAMAARRQIESERRQLRERLRRHRSPGFGDDAVIATATDLCRLGWPKMAIRLLSRITDRIRYGQRMLGVHFYAAWQAQSVAGAIEALGAYRAVVPAGDRTFAGCLGLGLLQQGRVSEALAALGDVPEEARDDDYRLLCWRACAASEAEIERWLPDLERAVNHGVTSGPASAYITSLAMLRKLHVHIEDFPHIEAGFPGLLRPKLIVQFWDSDIPDEVQSLVTEWRIENPAWQHAFFTQQTALAFIASHFSAELGELFLFCHHAAMKSDFFRLCFLYVCGGVYLDADEKLVMRADDFFEGWENAGFVGVVSEDLPFYVYNGFLCAVPGHPILRIAIELMQTDLRRSKAAGRKPDMWQVTGPGCITRAVAIYCRQVLGEGELDPDDLVLISDEKFRRFAHTPDMAYKREAKGNWRLA